MYRNILFEEKQGFGLLTLNRPQALNALDALAMEEIDDVIAKFRDDPEMRALIVTGAGDKALAAGADINELRSVKGGSGMLSYLKKSQGVFNRFEEVGKPTIAAIHGYAFGSGCELALAATFRLASASAKIGLPEIKLGSLPGMGGTQRLPRIIGKQKALEMMLTGRHLDAEEALRLGLVAQVLPDKESLLRAACELAANLAQKAPIAVRLTIEAVNRGMEMNLAEAQVFEAAMVSLLYETEDMQEGIAAFIEKRAAKFSGK